MPHIVTHSIKATEVRKGDQLVAAESSAVRSGVTVFNKTHAVVVTVESIKRGDKNVTFETTAGRVIIATDGQVDVDRVEATEAEKAADLLTARRRWFEDAHRSSVKDPAVALEEYIAKARENNYAEFAGYSEINKFLAAQAQYKIAKHAEVLAAELAEEEIFAELHPTDLLAASYHQVVTGRERRSSVNPLSRSTSTVSNLMEDLDTWATDEFKSGYMGGAQFAAECHAAVVAIRRQANSDTDN